MSVPLERATAGRFRINATTGLIIARAWSSFCGLATLVVVGTFLTPVEFGTFALASSISMLPTLLVGAGFYERTLTRMEGPTAWATAYWCSAVSGLAAMLIILAIAGGLTLLSYDLAVVTLLVPLSLVPTLWGLTVIHEASVVRDGSGGSLVLVFVMAETMGFALLLIALACGYQSGALVAAKLCACAVSAIGFRLASKRSVLAGFSLSSARENLRFATDILSNRFVGWLDGYGVDLLIAGVLSAGGLGLYRMGSRLYLAGGSVFIHAPGIAHNATAGRAAQAGGARLAAITARYVTLQAALALPVFAGLAASATVLVELFLRPEWRGAGTVTAILCLAAPGWVLYNAVSAVLLAQGRSRQLLLCSLASAIIGSLSVAAGAFSGPSGIAAARSIAALALAALMVVLFLRIETLRRSKLLLTVLAICTACVAYAVVTWTLLWAMGEGGPIVLRLAKLGAANVAGLATYLVVLRILTRQTYRIVCFTLLAFLVRKPAARGMQQIASLAPDLPVVGAGRRP